ncbi:interleukin-18-like [Scyliorhinus canicula]|uniref:interleukin-18-like n=1 Tax=Scyliorhinus canicula TaxID=7830 RepID=UPI0018F56F2B|nr:interleukin-18-like [Scyliorhinus canicula]
MDYEHLELCLLEFRNGVPIFNDSRSVNGSEVDCFRKYDRKSRLNIIRNIYGEILMAYSDGEADPVPIFEHHTFPEKTGDNGTNFNLVLYRKHVGRETTRGLPIVFQIKVSGSDYHMYCTEEGNRKVLKFKEGIAPTNVEENMKNIIFYQQYFDGTYFKFESAWACGWFLCTEEKNRLHTFALKRAKEGKDEMIAVFLDNVL